MSEWLKIELAEKLGIAANFHFPLPSSFIWSLYQNLLPNVPATSPFNKDRLRWHIYELLPTLLEQSAFKDIADYLAVKSNHTDEKSRQEYEETRRLLLSEKIADAYDNYLMYRQQWLAHWEAGHNDLPVEAFGQDQIFEQQWQAILWRELNSQIKLQTPNSHHRVSLHNDLLRTLANASSNDLIDKLPERLTVFGISSMPKHQLEVLQHLSLHIDVDVYWNNPCQHYWGDIQSAKTIAKSADPDRNFIIGNPLLASWGKVGKDFLDLLTTQDTSIHDFFIELPSEDCLSNIQADILNLSYRGEQEPLSISQINSDFGIRKLQVNDDSLRIHRCHSRLRELEVLKDQLLHWFDTHSDLTARDIIVMVPDINHYAPFIDAVFGHQPSAPELSIPYSISDRSGLADQPLLTLFTELLTLPHARFKASDLIGWLENQVIMDTFELELEEIEKLKRWITHADIKWGIDASHKSRWQSNALPLNTWLHGIKRLLLGFSNGSQSVWNGIASFNDVSGLEVNTLAKLITFVSYLTELAVAFATPVSASMWQQNLSELIENLFEQQHEHLSLVDKIGLQKIRDALQKLAEYEQQGDCRSELNSLIVHNYLKNELTDSGVSQRFLAGRVNFCTLMPMRSVPFDVVCILGLNDGDFPRQVHPLSFDLVNLNPSRKGDRSRKLDERYLFLEAVCSARQKLHLSFVGQSSRDNSEQTPSILLAELLEYLDDSFIVDNPSGSKGNDASEKPSKIFQISHALQPFNEQYFVDNPLSSQVKSYNKQWLGNDFASKGVVNQSATHKQVDIQANHENTIIDLGELISFAKHPIKYFYRQNLSARLEIEHEQIDDLEPFEHDSLTGYDYVKTLCELTNQQTSQLSVQQQDLTALQENLLASGAFPPKNWGATKYQEYQDTAQQIYSHYEKVSQLTSAKGIQGQTVEQKRNVIIGSERSAYDLQGQVKIENGIAYLYGYGKSLLAKHKLEGWLTHLFLAASGAPCVTVFLSVKAINTLFYPPVSRDYAREQLALWCDLFEQVAVAGRPLLWHAEGAFTYLEKQQASENEELALLALEQYRLELYDAKQKDDYLIKWLGGKSPLPADFIDISESVLLPCVKGLEKVSLAKPKLDSFFEELADKFADHVAKYQAERKK